MTRFASLADSLPLLRGRSFVPLATVPVGLSIAAVIVVSIVLLSVLGVGWYHAVMPRGRCGRKHARHGWLYVALIGFIASATPLIPTVIFAGMQRYGRVPMAPFVVLLKL
ncbi:MAG TPA: hypothetical protein VGG64_17060 [Pirellulales bacterium]|jgi:hypothetical protein